MITRLLRKSFYNQKKAMALMIVSIAVGTALTASLLTLSFEIGGKVSKELRAFGANILVEPRIEGLAGLSGLRRYLRSEDVMKVKTIFWRHNILGISPLLETDAHIHAGDRSAEARLIGGWYEKELPLPGEAGTFTAGIKTVSPSWSLTGRWPADAGGVVLGSSLAATLGVKIGDELLFGDRTKKVEGILDTGGREDDQAFMDLVSLQQENRLEGKISRVFIGALTTPMEEFAYKDPAVMSKVEYEKWYCTGYVTSIAKQVEEVFGNSRAKPVWQIAGTEGKVLDRLKALIYLLCGVVLVASSIGVSTTMIMSLLRRIEEIGLLKAMGADRGKIIAIFLSEAGIIGLAGGFAGYLLSMVVSEYIGVRVFQSGLQQRGSLLFIALGSAVFIAVLGTVLPIRRALRIRPGVVLKGSE